MDFCIGAPIIDMKSNSNANKFLIMDMGAKGALEIKKIYKNAIFVYIIPSNYERLVSQMEYRDASRLKRSKAQIESAAKVCDWLIINDDTDIAVTQIEKIMHTIKEYGERIDELDIETMKFLYSRNFHNQDNINFLKNFYPDDLIYTEEPIFKKETNYERIR